MRKAFTIIELLLVIGIIGVLTGIVTTAAAGAMRNTRSSRMSAMCNLVKAGIDTYHAQYGKWPGNVPSDPDNCDLTGAEVKAWMKEIVTQSKNGTPVMDVSGLFVSEHQGEKGQKCYGRNFMEAIRGTRKHRQRMKIDSMYFGYQDPSTGYFRRFRIRYSIPTDTITVTHQ